MASQTSDLPSDSLPAGSGTDSEDSLTGPVRYKKGHTLKQCNDSWNRGKARLEKHTGRLLLKFPPERFEQARKVSQQRAQEERQREQQEQQQQPSTEPASAEAEAGEPSRLGAALTSEEGPELSDSEQQQWNEPMAMLLLHAPHGKQSLFRSNQLSAMSSEVAHKAAMIACSAVENVADQQRIAASTEAIDLPQPRLTSLVESGTHKQKKRLAPSKDLRARARTVWAKRVQPQLNKQHIACIRGDHEQRWRVCQFSQRREECPAGEGCYSIRQMLAWPPELPLAEPSRVSLSSKQNHLLMAWAQAGGRHVHAEQQRETTRY